MSQALPQQGFMYITKEEIEGHGHSTIPDKGERLYLGDVSSLPSNTIRHSQRLYSRPPPNPPPPRTCTSLLTCYHPCLSTWWKP